MKISLLAPDSKQPNLACMKISAFHKAKGDQVTFNFPLQPADYTYASLLYSWTPDPYANMIGGSKYPQIFLPDEINQCFPDYDLYPRIDYSLGYTYKACPRKCWFCIVSAQCQDKTHYSIWTFHDPKFKKICLMNNNTLADPEWRKTFEEIWDAGLTMVHQKDFDARLITDESAEYIAKTKIDGQIRIAWDFPKEEEQIKRGINHLLRVQVKKIMCYVLIGHTTHEENLHRVLTLKALGIDPFVMPLNKKDRYQKDFARWVNHKAIFKSVKWEDYKKVPTPQAAHNTQSSTYP